MINNCDSSNLSAKRICQISYDKILNINDITWISLDKIQNTDIFNERSCRDIGGVPRDGKDMAAVVVAAVVIVSDYTMVAIFVSEVAMDGEMRHHKYRNLSKKLKLLKRTK